MYFEGSKNNVYVEVAMQHNDSYVESVYSFVNNINTPEQRESTLRMQVWKLKDCYPVL